MTPHQAIRRAIDATDHGRWRIDYDEAAMRIMENLAAAGFHVVPNEPEWDVIAAMASAAWFEPDDAEEAIGRLRERGYEVVSSNLVEGLESIASRKCLCDGHLFNPPHGGPCCGVAGGVCVTCQARAIVARHRGDDELEVFKPAPHRTKG